MSQAPSGSGGKPQAVPEDGPGGGELVFGPYRLQRVQRRLVRGPGDEEVNLGGRAFDILLVLIESAGKILSQGELIERAWPGLVVEEANLRVQIAALRKALGDGSDGVRYIETIPRRGYCFVAEVGDTRLTPVNSDLADTPGLGIRLPPALGRMVGRQAESSEISDLIWMHRFVSVVGPGGIGKTTVALSVAHDLASAFEGEAVFVDLAAMSSGDLVPVAIAGAIGVPTRATDVTREVLTFLRGRRMLLVLDNCEHVIDDIATLARRMASECPSLFILATSREAMRVEGEYVYLLGPLEGPDEEEAGSVEEALSWPAVQLFMERAAAYGHRTPLRGEDVPYVAAICRRLDGIALAIELAAGRVASHGIRGTAELLDYRFRLVWQGRRGALARHQTMNAAIDWSFNLLTPADRTVLARLSVFIGSFAMADAQQVAGDETLSALDIAGSLASLSEKSLIWSAEGQAGGRFRLLDTTRTYAAEKLGDGGARDAVCLRHAHLVADQLAVVCAAGRSEAHGSAQAVAGVVSNLRAALDWSFPRPSVQPLAVELVAKAVPLMLDHSLFRECHQWCEGALELLPSGDRRSAIALTLWEGIAVSTMFAQGNRETTRSAIDTALELARELENHELELRLLNGLHMFMTRTGNFRAMAAVSDRACEVAARVVSDDAMIVAEWMMGTTSHLCGDQAAAQRHCEAALRRTLSTGVRPIDVFGFDNRIRGLIVLTRILWLRGFLDQAARLARQVVAEAEQGGQPVALCIALIYTNTVALWSDDLAAAQVKADRLVACAAAHSLEPYRAVGLAMQGEIAVRRGELDLGIAQLRTALSILEAERHRVLTTGFLLALAEGLAAKGQSMEAATVLDHAFAQAEASGESYLLPELHRARGDILMLAPASDLSAVLSHFHQALASVRAQETPGLGLRVVLSLARVLIAAGRRDEARTEIERMTAAFDEGFDQPVMRSLLLLLNDRSDGALD